MRIAVVSLRSLVFHVAGVPGGGGGAEAQLTALAQSLARRGHDVRVIVTEYSGERRAAPRLTNLPLINAYNAADGLPGLRFLTPRWSGMMRALKEADAEVYFQMCSGLATFQCARFCRDHGRAFVFASASDSDVVPDQIRLSARDRWFYRRGLRGATAIITQHGRQAALLQQHFGLDSTPLPMGVEIPAAPGRPADPPVILWLGSLRSVKRPSLWLEIARRLPDVRFVMVGGPGSDPDFYETIRREAAGVSNVNFRGPVPEVAPFLDSAWLLLNTSRVEGFPNTFLEAWARAIPTVSFFDPDDVVRKNGLGRVVADPDEMVSVLRTLLGDRAQRDALGEAGRAYVRREHSLDAVAQAAEEIFVRAIERARRRA